MNLDFALVSFRGGHAAGRTFAAAKDRSGADAPWSRQVGLIEHHRDGHMVLRGTFAGHYVDVDEALHVSGRGTVEGVAAGGLGGALLGPPGIAVGIVVGGMLGSQIGASSETDSEPLPLVDQLRSAVPRSGSAILLIAEPRDVEEMLAAIGDAAGEIVRGTLTPDEAAALEVSMGAMPPASAGPSEVGEVADEASEPQAG